MKRALTGIATVGILAVTVGVETANATALREPILRSSIHPKAAARFAARAFCELLRLPTRTVRKPQEVVILVTIEACLMVDTDDRQWGRRSIRPATLRRSRFTSTICASCGGGHELRLLT